MRVSADLYQRLREIRLSLESQYSSAAPTVQDLVSIAIERSIRDWNNPEQQTQLLEELLAHRKAARSRMGQRNRDSS
ncbi:hypothetical protein [Chamaesiphon polymorphus]|uniref:hypothetical protein n=1 Tax=Chamaesiphon polymorphus TaxID=2107691 RepID=UPI001C624DE2|nr:hypothetical protein [Chamaesiphon polymorphus]